MTKVFLVIIIALTALLASATHGGAQKHKTRPHPTPTPTPWPNEPPSVKLSPSLEKVVMSCDSAPPDSQVCRGTGPKVGLQAYATDPDGDTMLYTYTTDGGRIDGDGPEVTLDLKGVRPGTYTVKVEVDDGNGGLAYDSTKLTVEYCPCDPAPKPPCPNVTVSCPSDPVRLGTPITFTANVSGGDPSVMPTYNWTVSAGTITSGQGTSSITVDMTGIQPKAFITATVELGGYDRGCSTASSCTAAFNAIIEHGKIDEYGNIRFSDEKARLDNLDVELRNEPTARGYIICYGGRRSAPEDARRRCERAKSYITGKRREGPDRIVTVDGGYKEELAVELWIVPSGATPPLASPTVDPSEVKYTPSKRSSQSSRRRREF